MIFFTELDLWLTERLEPLREQLLKSVPVSLLPKEAASYSAISESMISVAIAQVSGQEFATQLLPDGAIDPTGSRYAIAIEQTQLITYEITIALRLQKRYNDKKDRQSLEYCVEEILRSLVGKIPPLPRVQVPVWLNSYQLLQPDGKQWSSLLNLRFSRLASPSDTIEDQEPLELEGVSLYADQDVNEQGDEVLEKTWLFQS
ncbi:MAG: hypothetical protein F6K55_03435 [Moorea sp. SIO4A3]|nr:hypothetical protein [Moorena sp. SIO4A3]